MADVRLSSAHKGSVLIDGQPYQVGDLLVKFYGNSVRVTSKFNTRAAIFDEPYINVYDPNSEEPFESFAAMFTFIRENFFDEAPGGGGVAGSGLYYDGDTVKLGLDFTDPEYVRGRLTQPTYLLHGDVLLGEYSALVIDNPTVNVVGDTSVTLTSASTGRSVIFDGTKFEGFAGLFKFSTDNVELNATNAIKLKAGVDELEGVEITGSNIVIKGQGLGTNNQVALVRVHGADQQAIVFDGVEGTMKVFDQVNNAGLMYAARYRGGITELPQWIPDREYVDSKHILFTSEPESFPAVTAFSESVEADFTVAGVMPGDVVTVPIPSVPVPGIVFKAAAWSEGTVTVSLLNATGTDITPPELTLTFAVLK